jgi:hypothetical protein
VIFCWETWDKVYLYILLYYISYLPIYTYYIQGLPFRAGAFDGAISISALQWLELLKIMYFANYFLIEFIQFPTQVV